MDNLILGLVFDNGANLLEYLSGDSANANPSLGQLMYFTLIYDFIRHEIKVLGFSLMQRGSYYAALAATALVTMWVFYQGLRILSGKGDSLMALVLNASRVAFIVTAAISMGVASSAVYDTVGVRLPGVITGYVTNSNTTAEEQIDDSLAAMQFAMSSIDVINVAGDPTRDDDKNRAMYMVAVGTAGPAITAGAMLLFYQVAIALFIGLGPIFILCLMFDQTKFLFSKWLLLGISTMFSMALLTAMVSICLKAVIAVAIAHWIQTGVASLFGLNLGSGITTIAMQQGGIGLLMTLLIISVPPMAGAFFQGTVGGFATTASVAGGFPQPPGQAQSATRNNQPTAQPAPVNQSASTTSSTGAMNQAPQVGAAVGSAAVTGGARPATAASDQSTGKLGAASATNPASVSSSTPTTPGVRYDPGTGQFKDSDGNKVDNNGRRI
jgi:type IV secretion system protein VirB6